MENKKQLLRLQRTLLQQEGLEKEFRKLQRRIKKEMNGARPYLYKDIEQTIGEPVCIILVFNENEEILAKAVGYTVDEVIRAMEDFLDE